MVDLLAQPVLGLTRVSMDTSVKIVHEFGEGWGTVRNLSRGGIFVEAERPIRPTTEVALEFQLPDARGADDAFVRELNRTWRNMDVPTNVLAFPCSSGDERAGVGAERLLGDVIVAFQTTQREAVELHLPLEHHFAHLIIHGVLHLLGYDHIIDSDAVIMEKLEVEALARLGIGDPYAEDATNF